jgi:hypothetical protein
MTANDPLISHIASRGVVVIVLLAIAGGGSQARAEPCRLSPQHAGMVFPVEHLTDEWACRLKPIIDHYTTANRVGPLKTAMDRAMYVHLLDRPPLAAALINRLDLAVYKAEIRGPGRWWGHDGEGAEGIVHLVHHDLTTRVYYLEGTHRSRLLPNVSGKAVVFLRMNAVKETSGLEAMESTMVAYTMLDNRLLSGLASLLRPLISATVSRKLANGVDVVNRLGLEMRQHPDRVLFEATDPPPLSDEDVAFLKNALTKSGLAPAAGQGPATP